MEPQPGQRVFQHYVVERFLAAGGMGRVYLGNHERLGRPVVLKLLSVEGVDTPSARDEVHARFEREARLMTRVRHPNVVGILDYGTLSDGTPCIVMEYADGEPLSSRLRRDGPLPWPMACRLVAAVTDGLEAMHAAGVLHRDLKPSNVIVPRARVDQARLIDFGIARPIDGTGAGLTSAGVMIGTPEYMAPEQILGLRLGPATDLYAAGTILYELVTGDVPFPCKDVRAMTRRLTEAAPRPAVAPNLPPLPGPLAALLDDLLQRDPSERPSSADEVARRLRGLLVLPDGPGRSADATRAPAAGPGPTPRPAAPPPEPRRPASASAPAQAIVAARIPRSVLAGIGERRWLAGLLERSGRSFVYRGENWVALIEAPDAVRAAAEAQRIVEALCEHLGADLPIATRPAPAGFTLTAAQLTGASALPGALSDLLATLPTGPRLP